MTVRETIDTYFESLTAGDAAKLIGLISTDDSFVKIGTEAGEVIRGGRNAPDYYRHIMDSAEDFSIDTLHLDIEEREKIAWFLCEQTWHLVWQGKPETLDVRITGVLEMQNTVWQFVQIHASQGVE